MRRSLFSGVAGLKTHQTKMDVIGNNVANVNTVAYKSQSIVFADLMYQTTQSASGPNAVTGAGGINARQIGLGVKSAAINTAITTPGSTQTTGNPFDLKINGDAFFIVSNGVENFFTRDGSFYVDAAGNLAMTSNGYNVMGWQVDEETGKPKADTVSALRIMSKANLTYPPDATTDAYITGLCDRNDPDINSTTGKIMNLNFYDAMGYSYTAKLSVHKTTDKGTYYVQLDDIMTEAGESLKDIYNVTDISEIASLGGSINVNVVESASVDTNVATPYYVQRKAAAGDTITTDFTTANVQQINLTKADGSTAQATGVILDNGVVKYYTDGNTAGANLYDTNGKPVYTTTIEGFKVNGTNVPLDQLEALDGQPDDANPKDLDNIFGKSLQAMYGNNYATIVGSFQVNANTGKLDVTNKNVAGGSKLVYDETNKGIFDNIDGGDSVTLKFNDMVGTQTLAMFSDIKVDFSATSQQNNGGTATLGADPGTLASEGALGCGRKIGEMTGVSITQNGEIYASYDNGMSKLLGQIAVATFANASGLEKQGDNLYSATQNSGRFDGIGQDITADGTGSISTGTLEMSNVDLSSEFTEMITTQRGFQANSRIITVSDTLLEELTNLKR